MGLTLNDQDDQHHKHKKQVYVGQSKSFPLILIIIQLHILVSYGHFRFYKICVGVVVGSSECYSIKFAHALTISCWREVELTDGHLTPQNSWKPTLAQIKQRLRCG